MHTHIKAVDGFFADPNEVRDHALSLDYKPVEHEGFTYNGIGLSDKRFDDRLQMAFGGPVYVSNSFFRLNVESDKPTTYIHPDTGMNALYACVAYLNENEAIGGTAFWTHRETRLDQLPVGSVTQEEANRLNEDGNNEEKWSINSVVGMKFNRAVIYPTRYFHSRYPQDAWGKGKEDGRLIWAAFFSPV